MKPQIPWLRVFVEGVVIVGGRLSVWATERAYVPSWERSAPRAAFFARLIATT